MLGSRPQSHLIATSIEHCLSLTKQPICLDHLEDVNVVVVFDNDERTIMLASVKPPNTSVTVLLNDVVHNITIQDLFNTVQNQAIAWCEI